jgi:hypothetical protein
MEHSRPPATMRGMIRPQFKLRTLFVLMTLVALCFAYTLSWIHRRHEAFNWMENNLQKHDAIILISRVNPNYGMVRTPWYLWLCGERLSLGEIRINADSSSPQDMRRFDDFQELFPESVLSVSHDLVILDYHDAPLGRAEKSEWNQIFDDAHRRRIERNTVTE